MFSPQEPISEILSKVQKETKHTCRVCIARILTCQELKGENNGSKHFPTSSHCIDVRYV